MLGGTGFIGPAVVARLLEAGHNVTLFHRGEHELPELEAIPHIHGDRAHLTDFGSQLRNLAPDVVLDMAPMSGADAQTAMSALRGIAGRIVAISSVDVYRAYGRMHGSEPGPPELMPLREDSPLREKLYPYRGQMGPKFDDYDKIPVEHAVLGDRDLPGTILRLPAVNGERDNQRRLRAEVERMDAGRAAIILPMLASNWRWSRAYVGNVADAIVLAVTDDRAADRIYNVAEPETLTQEAWTRAVADAIGWHGAIVAVPDELLPDHLKLPIDFRQDMVVDSSRIRSELGFRERISPEEGIRRTVEWERAQPQRAAEKREAEHAAEDRVLASIRHEGTQS